MNAGSANVSDGSRERRWFHFSLRTLILLVLLIGSAMSLWHNWPAWALTASFTDRAVTSFSPNSRLAAVSADVPQVHDTATGRLVATLDLPPNPDDAEKKYLRDLFLVFSSDGQWLAGFHEGRHPLDRRAVFWRTSDWSFAYSARGWEYNKWSGRMGRVGLVKQSPDGPIFTLQEPLPEELTRSWSSSRWNDHPFMYFDYTYIEGEMGFVEDKRSGATAILPGNYHHVTDTRFFSDDGKNFSVCVDQRSQLWTLRRPMQWWGVACLGEFWLTIALAGAFIWSVKRTHRAEENPSFNT